VLLPTGVSKSAANTVIVEKRKPKKFYSVKAQPALMES
jgi:hypothetical protein